MVYLVLNIIVSIVVYSILKVYVCKDIFKTKGTFTLKSYKVSKEDFIFLLPLTIMLSHIFCFFIWTLTVPYRFM